MNSRNQVSFEVLRCAGAVMPCGLSPKGCGSAEGGSAGELAGEPMVSFNRRDYSEHFRILNEVFLPKKLKPRIVVDVDGASSLITEV